ncbi:MAG: hypothetical protein RLZZ126_1794, partial [Pseudomonadota bacterium]
MIIPAREKSQNASGFPIHRIPYAAYTDRTVYEQELERFFYTGH